ncbi:MAG: hypothetical protein PWR20_1133 [Bacteroidales bacterium]|jgi:uncharacterized metal-binding protein|nr:hypothetical protein [Bacteroidales bacterium]MDN5330174.1 hypothetical protein [Bacteroidales bacterium]
MDKSFQYYVVSCSGASNTGKFSDEVARKFMKSGNVKMLCLARFSIDKAWAEEAKKDIKNIIVLDGCPIHCAEKIMLEAGITNYIHLKTTDFDIVKGKTPYSDEKANEIIEHIQKLMET